MLHMKFKNYTVIIQFQMAHVKFLNSLYNHLSHSLFN